MDWSAERLSGFAEVRKSLLDMWVGGSYGERGIRQSQPLNLTDIAVQVYSRQLSSATPTAEITTNVRSLKPVAEELQLALQFLLEHKIQFAQSHNQWVKDAIFMMGIMKVGITPEGYDEWEGFAHDAGRVFCDPVGFEDYIVDMSAKHWDQVDFEGNSYSVPIEELMDSPMIDKKAKRYVIPSLRGDGGFGQIRRSEWRAETISQGMPIAEDRYVQRVDLFDIWLPGDNLLVTLLADMPDAPALRVQEWTGPEWGMYHKLGFTFVPGNLIPLSPAVVWEDMVDLVQRLFIKLGEQADRAKVVLAAQNKARSTAEQIMRSADGAVVTTDTDPSMVREFVLGNADPQLLSTMMQFKEMWSYLAGNVDTLGGLAQQADTLGQERLLSGGANQRIDDMKDQVVAATGKVLRDIAYYLWNDPLTEIPITKKITENIEIDDVWNSDKTEGHDFFALHFKVNPNSLTSSSPSERLQMVLQLTQSVLMPMMPVMQEQGMLFDFKEFMRTIVRLSNVSELGGIIKEDTGAPVYDEKITDGSPKPSMTTRNYVRENVSSGPTPRAREHLREQAMLAGANASPIGGNQQGGQ